MLLTCVPSVQAHALQKHIAQLPEPMNVEAVIVSPLSRALQTAVGAFGGTSDEEGTAKPLMIKQAHILVSIPSCLPDCPRADENVQGRQP